MRSVDEGSCCSSSPWTVTMCWSSTGGALTPGPSVDDLGAELEAAGLAADVTLTREDDDLGDDLDLDLEVEIEIELGADGDDVDDVEWPDEPDWATWRFSAQGEGWAHIVAAASPGPVTSAVWAAGPPSVGSTLCWRSAMSTAAICRR
ncbi:hypothetical protein G7085_15640 [Tessaracoccus sp. HDW20]|uniref:hypothetical protein n=1 Tax=Tessaracoccus coleopterorum TaxID=2714950 RepID=UPI0018D4D665|nr:hypothetical protein [Tessaracoccus coleopterorum]NHB85556.1 hypothetical protein [Tessaracoccus coleopterorum]